MDPKWLMGSKTQSACPSPGGDGRDKGERETTLTRSQRGEG